MRAMIFYVIVGNLISILIQLIWIWIYIVIVTKWICNTIHIIFFLILLSLWLLSWLLLVEYTHKHRNRDSVGIAVTSDVGKLSIIFFQLFPDSLCFLLRLHLLLLLSQVFRDVLHCPHIYITIKLCRGNDRQVWMPRNISAGTVFSITALVTVRISLICSSALLQNHCGVTCH